MVKLASSAFLRSNWILHWTHPLHQIFCTSHCDLTSFIGLNLGKILWMKLPDSMWNAITWLPKTRVYSTWSKELQNSREAISAELLHRMQWNLILWCIFRCCTLFKVFNLIRWTFFTTFKGGIFQPIWSHHWILRKISLNLKKKINVLRPTVQKLGLFEVFGLEGV